MSEAPYEELPFTGINRRTPTNEYQVDAENILSALQKLAEGKSLVDKSITTRTLSDEVMALLTLGFKGVVDTFGDLPEAGNEGDIYLVRLDSGGSPEYFKGLYRDNGSDWEQISGWVESSTDLKDMPGSVGGGQGKYLAVNETGTGYEFRTRYDRVTIKKALVVEDNAISWIADHNGKMKDVVAKAKNASIGADPSGIIFDLKLNGVSVFSEAGGVEYSKEQTDLVSYAGDLSADLPVFLGDLFEVNITQIGATVPGGNGFYLGVLY